MGLFGNKNSPKKLYDQGMKHHDKEQYSKALQCFEQAAEAGNRDAMYMLVFYYADGHGVEKNMETSIRWLQGAAQQGHAVAQDILGTYYYKGERLPQDYEKAVYWYELSAAQGNKTGLSNAAHMHEHGLGTKQDYKKAVDFYTKSVSAGSSVAARNLGLLYLHGTGVETDLDLAETLLIKAYELGDKKAGAALDELPGLRKKQIHAAFAEKANAGDPAAQHGLGMNYLADEYDDEPENDYANALYWLEKAVDGGYAKAQHDLAMVAAKAYLDGFKDALPFILRLEQRGLVKSYAKTDMSARERAFPGLAGRDFPFELAAQDMQYNRVPFMVLDVIEAFGVKYPIVFSEQEWFTEHAYDITAVMFTDPEEPFFNTADGVTRFKGLSDDTDDWMLPVGVYSALRDADGRKDPSLRYLKGDKR